MSAARTTPAPAPSAFGVVNIYPEAFGVNNGFGAGYVASLINQLGGE